MATLNPTPLYYRLSQNPQLQQLRRHMRLRAAEERPTTPAMKTQPRGTDNRSTTPAA